MSSFKQQGLIEARVEEVWRLLADPARFPDWAGDAIAVTGVPTRIEMGSTFRMTGRGPLRMKGTTTYKVEQLDDLREIKLRCQTSGFYSHWLLTEAQGNTFTQVEYGVEPVPGLGGRALGALHTKRYLRRAAEDTLEAVRRTTCAGLPAEPAPPKK